MSGVRPTRAAALAAFAGAATSFAVPALVRAQSLRTVRFAASPAATQAEAFYAEQLGVFRQAGIAATLTRAARSAETLSAVARGDIDVASATAVGIGNAIIRGIPIRMIATGTIFVRPAPIGLFSTADAPPKTPRDLENATIGVNSLQDSQTLGVLIWLEQNKLATDKVKFVEIPFATMAAALKRGDVLAGCIVEPYISASRADLREISGVYDTLGTRWALGTWYARTDFIKGNADLAAAVTNALYATARRVNANPASIDPLLLTYSKVTPETLKTMIKPTWAERAEPSNVVPQLEAAARYKVMPRMVTYDEMTTA